MNKEKFEGHLNASTHYAIKFGSKFIKNKLSKNITYNVKFNCSCDDNLSGFDIYRKDDGKLVVNINFDDVVNELYRNGKVPAWINISICKSNRNNTRLMLECAGRYTNNINDLYYVSSGTYPFGVKSPRLLPWIKEGDRYYLLDSNSFIENIIDRIRWKYHKVFRSSRK